jgi:hypothetical protein
MRYQKDDDPIQSNRIMIQDADPSTLVPFSKTKLRSRGDRSFFEHTAGLSVRRGFRNLLNRRIHSSRALP